jgi:hypothetical protein
MSARRQRLDEMNNLYRARADQSNERIVSVFLENIRYINSLTAYRSTQMNKTYEHTEAGNLQDPINPNSTLHPNHPYYMSEEDSLVFI